MDDTSANLGIFDFSSGRSHRAAHVFIACAGGFLSTVVMYFVADYFGSIRGGAIFLFGIVPFILCSMCTLALALTKRNSGWWFKVLLVSVCLAPSIGIGAILECARIQDEMNRPFAAFREGIANPIPASVRSLQFLQGGGPNGPCWLLRFEINPVDLDRIIHDSGYVRVDFNKLNHTDDHFGDPNFFRVGDHDQIYQRINQYKYEYTLKVNAEHSAAIFRVVEPWEYASWGE